KRIWLLNLSELSLVLRWREEVPLEKETGPFNIDPQWVWRPLFVGLPSPILLPKMLPSLMQKSLEVLIYPHQVLPLEKRCREWNARLTPNMNLVVNSLQRLNPASSPDALPNLPPRLVLQDAVSAWVPPVPVVVSGQVPPLVDIDDPLEEMARLFATEEE